MNRLGADGSFDGETFKQIESDISRLSRTYKSSSDSAQRELGSVLDDINGALRDNLERSSSPEVRGQLKKLNTAWATLKRLEDAAANRAQSGGVFTVGDLMTSVKRAGGKRAFARGDAMLQDFGSMASKVIPNRLPDSGTTERALFNGGHGLVTNLLGSVTNPTATKIMEQAATAPITPVMSPAATVSGYQPTAGVLQSGNVLAGDQGQ